MTEEKNIIEDVKMKKTVVSLFLALVLLMTCVVSATAEAPASGVPEVTVERQSVQESTGEGAIASGSELTIEEQNGLNDGQGIYLDRESFVNGSDFDEDETFVISEIQTINNEIKNHDGAKRMPRQPRSLFGTEAGKFANTATLSTNNEDDYYFLTISGSSKRMLYRLISNNSNTFGEIYTVNYSTGYVYPTGVKISSGETKIVALPIGEYAIRISSKATITSQIEYRIVANATFPDSDVYWNTVINISNDLNYLVRYDGTFFWVNDWQTRVTLGNNPSLSFNKSMDFGYSRNGYVDIGEPNVVNVSKPFKYTSGVGNSDLAIKLYLGEGTLYTIKRSILRYDSNGNVTGTKFVFEDHLFGLPTPRRFDAIDAQNKQCLIYDVINNRVVDFYGNYNYLTYESVYSQSISEY